MKNKKKKIEIKRVLENYNWEKRGDKKYVVQTFLVTLEVRDIINRIKDQSWVVPTLQRENNIWDMRQKSDLIDSILKGYPIPGMMVVTAGIKQYILDGQQRITTLRDFCNDDFKLKLDDGVEAEYNSKKFSELSELEQRKITSTVIGIQNVTSTSPANDNSFMYEIFARINSGGTFLSRQEVRNAINASAEMEKIKKYAKNIMNSKQKSIFPNNKNYNEIISWMFRILYFILRGKKIQDINSFSHFHNKKNVSLDYLLDKFTSNYFEEQNGSSELLTKTIDKFMLEIEKNDLLEEWIMSFDISLNRTKKAQPTFIDCLSIYLGNNGKLTKFENQKKLISSLESKNDKDGSSFELYKLYFQQQTLNVQSIIQRYKLLFKKV